MFVTGPGGSGKSRVIKLVLKYAQDFCALLGVAFTSRTILVTVYSGVAATYINGETMHMGVHLNYDSKNIVLYQIVIYPPILIQQI